MKKYAIIFLTMVSVFFMTGCEDYLDREPLDKISSLAVYEDQGYIEAFLADIYSYMPNGFGRETKGHKARGYGRRSFLDCTTDLIANKSGYVEAWKYVNAGQSPSGGTALTEFGNWSQNYTAIYECNSMLEGLESSSLKNEPFAQYVKAETRFLRAFFYFDLVRRYGDVPLITEVADINDPDALFVARTPKEQIYDFVDSEFTAVAEVLPFAKDMAAAGLEWGRVSKEAIWGFHGRVLLHAERWSESAAMSKKVMDAVDNGTSDRAFDADYEALFLSRGGDKKGILFEIIFDGVNKGGTVDNFSRPPSNRGSWGGQHNPTEDLVRSYEMADGSAPTAENGYDPQNPYENRDPRLEQTVLHHGSVFYGIEMDLAWEFNAEDSVWEAPYQGDQPHAQGLATITGYYLKKFMDPDVAVGEFGLSTQSWIVLRLAEVYLNYAEAKLMADGPGQEVLNAINAVRARSAMPAVEDNYPTAVSDADVAFERIKYERKVELAFENHRFWDIRRWRIGSEICNGSVPINPENPEEGGYMACCYPLRQADGTILYATPETEAEVVPEGQKLKKPTRTIRNAYVWFEKNYLMAIPQDAMDKNPKLVQNPGY